MKDSKAVKQLVVAELDLLIWNTGKEPPVGIIFFTENAVFSLEAGKRSRTGYKSQPVISSPELA